MIIIGSLLLLSCGSDPVSPPPDTSLKLVIGDIEGDSSSPTCTAMTLPSANSINVGDSIGGSETQTFAALNNISGSATAVSFVFDLGGKGASVSCNLSGATDDLEIDCIRGNGPDLIKPWHIEGLTPGGSYTMTFTGGGNGSPGRSIRIFVDVNGNGTLDASEFEDLIGLDGVVETRTFGQTITADATGVIKGEYWGGSTNASGMNGTWRGWTIVSAP